MRKGPAKEGLAVTDVGIRVGQGFDVHRYSDDPERTLVLGGVRFDQERGLHGHSDADLVAHVCIEALLAAAGLPDIGQLFSDTDPTWANADSIDLLRRAAEAVRRAGWDPVNVSCTVVVDSPKLAPHREAMQDRLGTAAGAPVTVTGRRSEGLGALGRREGIAAWAVALVSRRPGDPHPPNPDAPDASGPDAPGVGDSGAGAADAPNPDTARTAVPDSGSAGAEAPGAAVPDSGSAGAADSGMGVSESL